MENNNDGTESKALIEILRDRGTKISKAERVRSLLEKQKKFMKKSRSLTDFDEPVLFFCRRDGKMEIFEKATAGAFTYVHSTGKERFIELRPADQVTFEYAGRRVRAYIGHEDRPFTGWDDPVVDSESVMQGYIKTKATDLKYQEAMARLGVKGKMTWLYVIGGIILAVGGVFILATLLVPQAIWDKIFGGGTDAIASGGAIPTAGFLFMKLKNKLSK